MHSITEVKFNDFGETVAANDKRTRTALIRILT